MPSPTARALAAFLLLLPWIAAPAVAQERPTLGRDRGNPDWYVRLAGYFWLSNIDGSNTVGGLDVVVTDSVLKDGWSAHAEVGKGRFRTIIELSRTNITNATQQISPAPAQGSYDFTVFISEVAGAAQVGGFSSDWAAEIFGGLRFIRYTQRLDVQGPVSVDDEFTVNLIEPFFGSRYFTELGRRFWFTITAHVGGFDMGSDFTWVLEGELGTRLARQVDFTIRYRYMETEFNNGRVGDQAYVWDDGQLQGWLFGLVIKR